MEELKCEMCGDNVATTTLHFYENNIEKHTILCEVDANKIETESKGGTKCLLCKRTPISVHATVMITQCDCDKYVHKYLFCSIACTELYILLCYAHKTDRYYTKEVLELRGKFDTKTFIPTNFIDSVSSICQNKFEKNYMIFLAYVFCDRCVHICDDWKVVRVMFEDGSQFVHVLSRDQKVSLIRIRVKHICSLAIDTNLVSWSDEARSISCLQIMRYNKKEELQLMQKLLKENLILQDSKLFVALPGLYCHVTKCERVITVKPKDKNLAVYGFNLDDIYWSSSPMPFDIYTNEIHRELNLPTIYTVTSDTPLLDKCPSN